jgi:gliding motility-associated-like protein
MVHPLRILLIVSLLSISSTFFNCNKSLAVKNCENLVNEPRGNDTCYVAIPNAFTPNGDGLNDIFRPLVKNIVSIKFTVYDQNNMVLFYTEKLNEGWPAFPGPKFAPTYYYRVEAIARSGRKIGLCGEFIAITCKLASVDQSKLVFEDQLDAFGNFTLPTSENLPSSC